MEEINKQNTRAFIDGFYSIIPDEIYCIFTPSELDLLLTSSHEINLDDLRAHCDVCCDNLVADRFWKIVQTFTTSERKKLIQFITGSPSVPSSGFASMNPNISIRQSAKAKDSLPISHTCSNQLDLPHYSSYQLMHQKLLYAINESSVGFGMA